MTEFRNATRFELGQILDWAGAEGWNPGIDDADAFYAADPEGFFVAVEDGVPVASISFVNHSDSFAFLGLYIAAPSHRGKGIGYQLWQHAIEHAGNRTIGLDGVAEQQGNYAASGFRASGGTTRFSGRVSPEESDAVRLAEASDVAGLIDKETDATGSRKEAYLGAWFTNTANRTTIVADDGFCTVRRCREGAKIGPLVAVRLATAETLIKHAASRFGATLSIDVPDSSTELANYCQSIGMTPGFQTARMYRGQPPQIGSLHFAVTTLELG